MKELADKRTRLARTLKRLAYKFDIQSDNWDRDPVKHVWDMLNDNHTLEYVHVAVPRVMYDRGYVANFVCFHNQKLPSVSVPFPVEYRVAFLSIFTSSSRLHHERGSKRVSSSMDPPVSSVLAEFPLDRGIVSLIFAFAASCGRRRMYFMHYD